MALMILLLGIIILLVYAYSVLGDIDVEIERVRIVETGNHSLLTEVDLVVKNPSIFSADTKKADLTLHHWGRKVGSFKLPPLHVGPGDNDISMTIVLREEDPAGMYALAEQTFTDKGAVARVKGKVSTRGPFTFDMDLDRRFEIGKGKTIDTRLDLVDILDDGEGGLAVDINATVVNSGMLESTLEGLSFDIMHNDTLLFSHSTEGMLVKGDNPMHIAFNIGPDDVERYRPLVSELADGFPPSIVIKGIDRNGRLLSRLSEGYASDFEDSGSDLGGLNDLEIDIVMADVTTDDSGLNVDVRTTIDNPSVVKLTLEGLNFDLSYNGTSMTTVSTDGILDRGPNELEFNITVPAENVDVLNDLAANALIGVPMTLQVAGVDLNGRTLSRLSTEFETETALSEEGGVDLTLDDVNIDLGILTTQIGITATLNNTLPATVNLTDFEFRAYYNGGQIGEIYLHDPNIVQGVQTVNATLDISILTLLLRIDLILVFLSGSPMEITIVGSRTFSGGHVLQASTTVVYGGS